LKNVMNIRFEAGTIPGGALAILEPAGVNPNIARIIDGTAVGWNYITVYLELDEHDKRIAKVVELLAQYGLKPDDMFTSIEYSEEDRQTAPLLQVSEVIEPQYYGVFDGPLLGTKFDMEHACPTCGTGARKISPLYIDIDDLPRVRKHRAIWASFSGMLVDGGIKKKLIDQGVTGVSFGDVYARLKNKKRTMVAREHIIPTHTMPPLSPNSKVDRLAACKTCHRGGVQRSADIAYRRQDLTDICDFNVSWEWFGPFDYDGNVKNAKFSSPAVLVTPKVMNILCEAGVKAFEWTPIFVDE
jgi:hypothetical protein